MHEKISIEIHVWPLTGPFSRRIDFFHLSYAYASSKNGIGKFGACLVHSWIPHANIRRRRGFVAIISDLENTRRSPSCHSTQTHRDTLFFLPHECSAMHASCGFSQICVCVCARAHVWLVNLSWQFNPRWGNQDFFCVLLVITHLFTNVLHTHCYYRPLQLFLYWAASDSYVQQEDFISRASCAQSLAAFPYTSLGREEGSEAV